MDNCWPITRRRGKADPNKPTSTSLNSKVLVTKFVAAKRESKGSIIGRVRDAGFSERPAKSMQQRAEGEGLIHRWTLDQFDRVGLANNIATFVESLEVKRGMVGHRKKMDR